MIDNHKVLTINKNENYLILDNASYKGKKYVYTVKVNKNYTKPLGVYTFFEYKNHEIFTIENDRLKDDLYNLFTERYLKNWEV